MSCLIGQTQKTEKDYLKKNMCMLQCVCLQTKHWCAVHISTNNIHKNKSERLSTHHMGSHCVFKLLCFQTSLWQDSVTTIVNLQLQCLLLGMFTENTLSRLQNRFNVKGTTADRPRSGLPFVTTPRQDRFIQRLHLTLRKIAI